MASEISSSNCLSVKLVFLFKIKLNWFCWTDCQELRVEADHYSLSCEDVESHGEGEPW